jgi:2-oxoglutarate dehydrogenase E2 component (dihydrolipoamide succinyltransferase)
VRYFAKAAEDGTLSLADIKGGTFTITNGGVFGSLLSTPILNPPQVGNSRPPCDQGSTGGRRRPGRDSPDDVHRADLDHRIIDGSEAVKFLVKVKELIEDPGRC